MNRSRSFAILFDKLSRIEWQSQPKYKSAFPNWFIHGTLHVPNLIIRFGTRKVRRFNRALFCYCCLSSFWKILWSLFLLPTEYQSKEASRYLSRETQWKPVGFQNKLLGYLTGVSWPLLTSKRFCMTPCVLQILGFSDLSIILADLLTCLLAGVEKVVVCNSWLVDLFHVSRFIALWSSVLGNNWLVVKLMLRRFLRSFSFLSLERSKQRLPPSPDKKTTHYRDSFRYSWAV